MSLVAAPIAAKSCTYVRPERSSGQAEGAAAQVNEVVTKFSYLSAVIEKDLPLGAMTTDSPRRIAVLERDEAIQSKKARQDMYRDKFEAYFEKNIRQKGGRKWEWVFHVDKKPGIGWEVAKRVALSTVEGTALGALGGALCAGVGAGPGAAVGAVTGFCSGLCIGGKLLYDEYVEWLKTEEGKIFSKNLIGFLEANPTIRGCCCIINERIPIDPVRSLAGHIYERQTLHEWVDEHHNDPVTRLPMTRADIREAHDVTATIYRELHKMVIEDIHTLSGVNRTFIEGLINVKKFVETNRYESFQQRQKDLHEAMESGKITPQRFTEDMHRLVKIFY